MKILLDDLDQVRYDIETYEQLIENSNDTFLVFRWRKQLTNLRNKRYKLEQRIASYNGQQKIDFQ